MRMVYPAMDEQGRLEYVVGEVEFYTFGLTIGYHKIMESTENTKRPSKPKWIANEIHSGLLLGIGTTKKEAEEDAIAFIKEHEEVFEFFLGTSN